MPVELSPEDSRRLDGAEGEGVALAMRVLVKTAEAMGAGALLDVVSAHVDGCLFHGQVGLDFAEALAAGGARTVVPTTLNVGSLDLLHPELVRLGPESTDQARRLMAAYVELGCEPTWTCAPYQLEQRPALGDQVAWAESNAIVFANSVLGARTERYGDFVDIAAALTGRAPAVGLHLDAPRLATLVLDVTPLADWYERDALYPLLGHVLGRVAGSEVAAIVGLPADVEEDRLKALGAAAASSGSVAMFHAVGRTPEAPDLATATGGRQVRHVTVTSAMLDEAAGQLSTASGGRVDAVSVGTPHYSAAQLVRLAELVAGRTLRIPLYVCTARSVLSEAEGAVATLVAAGAEIVTDTCTYITPILDPAIRTVMTDSAKWAYYAPANIGVGVVFGSMEACVEAAVTGAVGERW